MGLAVTIVRVFTKAKWGALQVAERLRRLSSSLPAIRTIGPSKF